MADASRLEASRIADGVWSIREDSSDGNLIYLVTGDEKALLIDAGWGVGDLAGLVGSLTPLPVTVVLTHGHPDHIFGGMHFPEVFISKEDWPLFEGNFSRPTREMFVAELAGEVPKDFSPERWVNAKTPRIQPLSTGQRFELGGRSLEAMTLPGHSPGCVVFFDDRERLLFTGDAVLEGDVWMHLDHSLPLREYWLNLKRLNEYRERFDRMLPGHGRIPVDPSVLDELIEGIAGILEGQRHGEPFQTFVGEGTRCGFGKCGVIYDPKRL